MNTVQAEARSSSSAPALALAPAPCSRFSWCTNGVSGHAEHFSAPVDLVDARDRFVFAETDLDTGALLYGPVLGGGESEESVEYGRALAAELRASAARIEALVARVELAGGAA